jgi:hypothetical protein
MVTTNNPKQEFYLRQVTQLYNQVQAWGKDKFDFVVQEQYPISDETGDYHAQRLTILKKSTPCGEDGLIDFLPRGMTFLTGKGVIEVMGPLISEELVYLREDNLIYTERDGRVYPLEEAEGFKGEGWYWMVLTPGHSQWRPLTPDIFGEFVKRGADLFNNEARP